MVEAKKQSALVPSFSFSHIRSPYGFGCFANSTEDKGHIGGRVAVKRLACNHFELYSLASRIYSDALCGCGVATGIPVQTLCFGGLNYMSENFKQILESAVPDSDTLCLSESEIIAAVEKWLILRRANLGKHTVSAYQKAILESEYDRLLMELI